MPSLARNCRASNEGTPCHGYAVGRQFRSGGVGTVSPVRVVIYPVKDLTAAKRVFSELLGVAPYADQPYYVGFRVGDQEVGLDPNGHKKGMTGPVPYFEVSDIKATLARLVDAGAQVHQDVTDVGGGRLIALVKDGEGNRIGLMQNP